MDSFEWGPMEVAQLFITNQGKQPSRRVHVLGIKTERSPEWMEIRVTPQGLVKVFGPDGVEWLPYKGTRIEYRRKKERENAGD